MTKAAALQKFFSSFGIPAYVSTSVPDDAEPPYLTYTYVSTAFGNEPVSLTVNLWYRTTSEAIPNAKAQELSEAIGYGGKLLPCDEGYIWLKRDTTTSLDDPEDSTIKRRYINVTAEYLTFN